MGRIPEPLAVDPDAARRERADRAALESVCNTFPERPCRTYLEFRAWVMDVGLRDCLRDLADQARTEAERESAERTWGMSEETATLVADLLRRMDNAERKWTELDAAGDRAAAAKYLRMWYLRGFQADYLKRRPADAECVSCKFGNDWPKDGTVGPPWYCLDHATPALDVHATRLARQFYEDDPEADSRLIDASPASAEPAPAAPVRAPDLEPAPEQAADLVRLAGRLHADGLTVAPVLLTLDEPPIDYEAAPDTPGAACPITPPWMRPIAGGGNDTMPPTPDMERAGYRSCVACGKLTIHRDVCLRCDPSQIPPVAPSLPSGVRLKRSAPADQKAA